MQKRSIIIRWGIPFLLLMIVIGILLVNFSIVGKEQTYDRIKDGMVERNEDYAQQLYNELNVMTESGKTVADVLGSIADNDEVMISKLTRSLCSNSQAYRVVYANMEGIGTDQNGKEVDISAEPYYRSVLNEQKYNYVKEECMEQRSAIISMLPISRGSEVTNVLYIYYPVERFNKMFLSASYTEDTFYALMMNQGKIVQTAGACKEYLEKNNLYTLLFKEHTSEENVQDIWHNIEQSGKGCLTIESEELNVCMTYAPVKINDWYIIVGVNNSKIERLADQSWHTMHQLVVQLLIVIFAFAAFVIIINVVNKVNYSRHSKSLEEKADTDLLTGLYNKIATEREIKEYIEKHKNEKALFFLIDIDNFKKINDTKGHAFGDEVLRYLGGRLKMEFRQTDIIGRIGGDEIVLFLKNMPDKVIMQKEIGRVAEIFQNIEIGEYVKYVVTASIGVAVYPTQGSDFTELYAKADKKLYEAKKRGKNCMEYYLETESDTVGQCV